MFVTSQPEKPPFGQPQTPASKHESKTKALTQQLLEETLLFILCYSKKRLLCSKGQSLPSGWTPESCDFTCCHLAMSTPALGYQESPALLLFQKKKKNLSTVSNSSRIIQESWMRPPHAHIRTSTNISALHFERYVCFFHLAFSHCNSEECLFLKKLNQSPTEKADQNWACHRTSIFPRGEDAKANKTWQMLAVVFNVLLEGVQIL